MTPALRDDVLDWAKTERPDAYALTIAVESQPAVFRRYVLRLVELRCEADHAFRSRIDCAVLDETGLCVTMRRNGKSFTVGGRLTTPPPNVRWALLPHATTQLLDAVVEFDLEVESFTTGRVPTEASCALVLPLAKGAL